MECLVCATNYTGGAIHSTIAPLCDNINILNVQMGKRRLNVRSKWDLTPVPEVFHEPGSAFVFPDNWMRPVFLKVWSRVHRCDTQHFLSP